MQRSHLNYLSAKAVSFSSLAPVPASCATTLFAFMCFRLLLQRSTFHVSWYVFLAIILRALPSAARLFLMARIWPPDIFVASCLGGWEVCMGRCLHRIDQLIRNWFSSVLTPPLLISVLRTPLCYDFRTLPNQLISTVLSPPLLYSVLRSQINSVLTPPLLLNCVLLPLLQSTGRKTE